MHEWPGQDGPLICLPDTLCTGRSFAALGEALTPAWRVLALDPRGHGESDKPLHGYGYQVQVADLLNVLDSFGFARAILVGHGYGATIALLVAALHPSRVKALILIDGGTPVPNDVRQADEQLLEELDVVHPSVDAFLALVQSKPAFHPWDAHLESYFRSCIESTSQGAVRMRGAHWAVEQETRTLLAGPPDYPALHAAVACPTLIVKAAGGVKNSESQFVPVADYQAMLRTMSGAHGVLLDTVNHYTVMLGSAVETVRHVRAFLRSFPA